MLFTPTYWQWYNETTGGVRSGYNIMTHVQAVWLQFGVIITVMVIAPLVLCWVRPRISFHRMTGGK